MCADGFGLAGTLWRPAGAGQGGHVTGTVVIAPATGVLARYYARFAAFLAEAGLHVVTFDYRGIGGSRPADLRSLRLRWADWGRLDLEAALRHAALLPKPLAVVGHSIGGVLVGYAASAPTLDCVLTVGSQYAYWRDYTPASRRRLWLRWHVVMPALTLACGAFPGRRLGWLEDIPRGVALDWAFRGARLEASHPRAERAGVLAGFAAVRAPLLALAAVDDPYATLPAMQRTLRYFTAAERSIALLDSADWGVTEIGHFAPFHDRFRVTLWPAMLGFLSGMPFPGARPFTADIDRRPQRRAL